MICILLAALLAAEMLLSISCATKVGTMKEDILRLGGKFHRYVA